MSDRFFNGFAIFFFLLSACNSGENKNQRAPKSYIVEIAQMKFNPAELTVQNGDTIVFVNHDMVPHDITEEPGETWSSSLLPANQSWSIVADTSVNYYCSIHVVMKGKIIVQ